MSVGTAARSTDSRKAKSRGTKSRGEATGVDRKGLAKQDKSGSGVLAKRSGGKKADASAGRSSAASRAYERRQQRAVAVLGDDVATGVLPKRSSAFAARIPFVATIIGMLSVGLMMTLLLTTRAAEDSYQLSAAREANQKLAQERDALQKEVQSNDSPPELAAKARDLGMIPAKDPAKLVVAPDGGVLVVGTPAPAQGAPAPLLNAPAPGATQVRPGVPTVPNRTPVATAPPAATPPAATPPGTAPPVRATPQTPNSPQVQAQGEQLVPMTISPQPADAGPR
ncbi:hypothetical protein [Antrihabitans stalagmiti]|uniref:hypothetical protein n=1 Tax=Antrihabitans stalagmiti TaxID=2799499 RepID=UPI001F2D6B36|nr:hypothetical protein [Antrihabitans stalagmiti]